jgi:hypothetical protein
MSLAVMSICSIIACGFAQTRQPSQKSPSSKATPQPEITINIGENDVSAKPASSSVSDPAVTTATQLLQDVFANQRARAQKQASDAANPYDAFPAYATMFVLDVIQVDYTKLQQASAALAETLPHGISAIDSKEKLETVKTRVDQLHSAATRLAETIKKSPGDVADKLVQQGYDQVSISKRLYPALSSGPLLAVKKLADNTAKKSEALQNLVPYLEKYWGKWKLAPDGSLSVSSEIPASDREEFRKAYVDVDSAMHAN